MQTAPRRKAEWLLGRVALKDAVRGWAIRRHRIMLAPQAIIVETTPAGAPFVRCAALEERGAVPAISLAHCPTLVLAGATDPGPGLGVDIEAQNRNVSTVARALTPEESAMTADGGVGVLEIVVAKEAAAKARGVGLGGSLARWPVLEAMNEGPHTRLRVLAPGPDPEPVTVWLQRREGYVVAVTSCDVDH